MPNRSKLHIDALLSQVSVKYQNTKYIASEVFPEVAVKKNSDLYRIYARNFRLPETRRADGALARQHDFDIFHGSDRTGVAQGRKVRYRRGPVRAIGVRGITAVVILGINIKT